MRLIDADELKKQAYKSGDWDKPLVVDVADIDDAPTVDQWHYPSKGEYPKNSEDVLCCYEHDIKAIGNYYASDGIWYCDALLQPYKVPLAWQYIVPPKEET